MMQKILSGLLVFVFSGLVVRLIDIQLIKGSFFADQADKNRMYMVSEPEQRGVLLDRYNQPLVFNKPIYYKIDSSESLYSEETRITREEALQIMTVDPELIRVEYEREYRYPESMAHVLGYIGSVTVDDLLSDSSLHISDKIGKMGLEYELQDFLQGKPGFKQYEINALGEKQHLVLEKEGSAGNSIPTTLDPYLSEIAYEALGDKLGSVVILDGETGEVLSMVSSPSFDLSVLSESYNDSQQEIERIKSIQSFFSHPQKLFFNRTINGAYPPGSVFKLVTALAGLENEKITSKTTVLDEGVLTVGDYSYANWYFTQFGRKEGDINLQKAIARSNDIYFYKVAEWVGPERIKEMAELFGLGKKTGVQLQPETEGLISDPEWKQRVLGERWFLGNTYHLGIGQGDLLVSPMQIAQMIQAITNRGTLCSPTVLSDKFQTTYIKQNRCREVGVLQENLELVVDGMLDACSSGGTGFPFFTYNGLVRNTNLSAFEEIDRGAVACKTGTSEFGAADSRGYRRTHGWFVTSFGTQELIARVLEKYATTLEQGEKENSLQNVDGFSEFDTKQSSESTTLDSTTVDLDVVTNSDQVEDSSEPQQKPNKERWVENVAKFGFPKQIVMVVLVESDEVNQYKEGSKDAGPVAKEIFDWMFADVVSNLNQKIEVIPEYSRE